MTDDVEGDTVAITFTIAVTQAPDPMITGTLTGTVREYLLNPNDRMSGQVNVIGRSSGNVATQTDTAGTYGAFSVTAVGV